MKNRIQSVPEIRETKKADFRDSRTVASIMRSKALDVLETNRVSDIAKTLVKFSVASTLAVSAFDAPAALEMARHAAQWSDYALPKSSAAFLAAWRWRDVAGIAAWTAKRTAAALKSESRDGHEPAKRNVPHAFGLPATEVAEFLFEKKGFPRDEFCEEFGTGRATHEKIAKGFDSLGILTRGENNARVLGDVDIGYVVSVLSRADEFGFVPLHDGEK